MEDKYKEAGAEEVRAKLNQAKSESRSGKIASEITTALAAAIIIGIPYSIIEAICKLYISDDCHDVKGNTTEALCTKKVTITSNTSNLRKGRNVLEEEVHSVNFRKETVIGANQQARQTDTSIDVSNNTVTTIDSTEIASLRAAVRTVEANLGQHTGNLAIHGGVEQHA